MDDQQASSDFKMPYWKDPVVRLALLSAAGLLLGMWAARAPTDFTGELPLVGSYIPQKVTAIYLVVLGPIAMAFVSIYLFMLASWLARLPLAQQTLGWTNGQRPIVAVLFVFLALLAAIFSIQYFTILAPHDLCATRPHFDFLWKSVDGFAITHCMSGTDEINAHGPYYFYPSIIQSWGHVAWPLVTAFFLAKTWRVWRANTKFAA